MPMTIPAFKKVRIESYYPSGCLYSPMNPFKQSLMRYVLLWLMLLLANPLSLYSQFQGDWYAYSGEHFVKLEIHQKYLVTIRNLATMEDSTHPAIDIDTVRFSHKQKEDKDLYIMGDTRGNLRFARFTKKQDCHCLKTGYFGFSIENFSNNKASFRKAVEASKKGRAGLTFHRAAAMDSLTNLKKLQTVSEEELVTVLERFYEELQATSGMVKKGKRHNRPERVLPAYQDLSAAHRLISAFIQEGFSPVFDKEATKRATQKYRDNQRIKELIPKIKGAMDSF